MLADSKTDRRADFAALEAAADGGLPVTLEWTAEDVVRFYTVSVEAFVPDGWYHKASAMATAADPVAQTVSP